MGVLAVGRREAPACCEAGHGTTTLTTAGRPRVLATFRGARIRFMVFAGMDGVVKHDISEIERERRNSYSWYNQAGEGVFQGYTEWRKRVNAER